MLPHLLTREVKSTVSVTATCMSQSSIILPAINFMIFILPCIHSTEAPMFVTKQNVRTFKDRYTTRYIGHITHEWRDTPRESCIWNCARCHTDGREYTDGNWRGGEWDDRDREKRLVEGSPFHDAVHITDSTQNQMAAKWQMLKWNIFGAEKLQCNWSTNPKISL